MSSARFIDPVSLNQAPILFTSRRTAELTKYAANAFLATKITFINEMADLREQVGAHFRTWRVAVGLDEKLKRTSSVDELLMECAS